MPPPVENMIQGAGAAAAPPVISMLKTPPKFNTERSLDRFINEVEIWRKVTTIPKESQGIILTIHLPDDGKYGDLKGRVMQMVDIEGEEGLDRVLTYLKENIGSDTTTDVFEKIQAFMKTTRKSGQTVRDFVSDFDTAYHVAQNKAKLQASPGPFLMYALLSNAKVSEHDWKLCLSSIDLSTPNEVYDQTKKALLKYCSDATSNICAGDEPTVTADGTFWNDWSNRGRGRGFSFQGKNFKKRGSLSSANAAKFDIGGYHPKVQRQNMNLEGKKTNKIVDGKVMTCDYCGSFMHLQANCWEKQQVRQQKN